MSSAGWYADPLGFKYFRYFDGEEWTQATCDSPSDSVKESDFLQRLYLQKLPPPSGNPKFLDLEADSFSDLYKQSRANETNLGVSMGAVGNLRDEIVEKNKRELVEEIFNPSSIADYRSRGTIDPRDEGWIVGQSGMVRFVDGLIEIKRTSIGMDLVAGNTRGDKAIPLRTVQAIQFKPASTTVGGMIEFVVAGDRSNSGRNHVTGLGIAGAVVGRRLARMGDENVITFNRTQEPPFRDFHNFLLTALREFDSNTSPTDQPNISKAAEIRELKALLDEGLLTAEEFESAKRSILGI